jgi:hypothetical protein
MLFSFVVLLKRMKTVPKDTKWNNLTCLVWAVDAMLATSNVTSTGGLAVLAVK